MNFVQKLLHPMGNVECISFLILKELGVKVTETTLSKLLLSHPDYPSLYSISQVLSTYGIESVTIKTNDYEKLKSSSDSFLCQIKGKQDQSLFAYVYSVTDQHVFWYNPINHQRETIEREAFCSFYTGYAMFFDISNKKNEEDYEKRQNAEERDLLRNLLLLLFLPLVAIVSLITHNYLSDTIYFKTTFLFVLLLLIGSMLGALTLLYEYNAYTPVLSKICSISRKTNCAATLRSPASHFFGIPWSVIGTAYFTGILVALISTDYSLSMINMVAYLHLLTLPYACWSFYYQYRVAKRWCPLCLSVLAAVVILFVWFYATGQYSQVIITLQDVITFILDVFIAFLVFFFLWYLSQEYRERKIYEISLSRLKLNKEVFYALLNKETKITMPTDDYGIILGNPHGSIHIVKVCNPYCSHCANAQPILQQLINRNKDIKLQMIFTEDPASEHYKDTPIDLFLSLYHEGKEMEPILSEWYAASVKDTTSFEQNYHTDHRNEDWNNLNAKKMHQFCEDVKIVGTPTVFINGHILPETYRIKDMLYLI